MRSLTSATNAKITWENRSSLSKWAIDLHLTSCLLSMQFNLQVWVHGTCMPSFWTFNLNILSLLTKKKSKEKVKILIFLSYQIMIFSPIKTFKRPLSLTIMKHLQLQFCNTKHIKNEPFWNSSLQYYFLCLNPS